MVREKPLRRRFFVRVSSVLSRGVSVGAAVVAVCSVCCGVSSGVCCDALCGVSSGVCCGALCGASSGVCCDALCGGSSGVCCGVLCGVSSGVCCGALCGVCCGVSFGVCCGASRVVSSLTVWYKLRPSRHGESDVAPRTVGTTSDRAIGRIIRMTLRRCMTHQSYDFCANIRFFFGFFCALLRTTVVSLLLFVLSCTDIHHRGGWPKCRFYFRVEGVVRAALSPLCRDILHEINSSPHLYVLNLTNKPQKPQKQIYLVLRSLIRIFVKRNSKLL